MRVEERKRKKEKERRKKDPEPIDGRFLMTAEKLNRHSVWERK